MTIRDTIQSIRDLAAEVPHDAECVAEDLYTAEFILASCEPPLSGAAYSHLMSMFIRLRERAIEKGAVPA